MSACAFVCKLPMGEDSWDTCCDPNGGRVSECAVYETRGKVKGGVSCLSWTGDP